ncbi:hypothetical protein ACJJTC_000670 [Scirpophaga incertulas]
MASFNSKQYAFQVRKYYRNNDSEHIGLIGNEQVDQMAKMAITCGVEVDYLPYYTDLLPDLRRKCFSMWSEYFDERSRSKEQPVVKPDRNFDKRTITPKRGIWSF